MLGFYVNTVYSRHPMSTVTKPTPPRTTDTLRQALATLAALMDRAIQEVNSLDSEFQERVLQAVHDTEESLQKQGADHVQRAIAETEQATRAQVGEQVREQVTEEFRNELQRLTEELTEVRNAQRRDLEDTEEAAAIALDRQISRAVERVRSELTAEIERVNCQLAESRAEFHREASEREGALADAAENLRAQLEQVTAENERAKLRLAEVEALNAKREQELAEIVPERDRFMRQVDELLHSAAQWDSERERFREEIQSANAATEAASSARMEASVNQSVATETFQAEVARVETLIQAISAIIDAPETELSLVIRKNVERAELESYLRGIRFAVTGR